MVVVGGTVTTEVLGAGRLVVGRVAGSAGLQAATAATARARRGARSGRT